MSEQDFMNAPDPYSSFLQNDEAIKPIYPESVQAVLDCYYRHNIYRMMIPERAIKLMTGNYLGVTYQYHYFIHAMRKLNSEIRHMLFFLLFLCRNL